MDKDFLKEKINYYKFWLTFIITADASIMAWGYNHFKILTVTNFLFLFFIISGLTCAIVMINKKARIFLKKLEDYKNGN